MDLPRLVPEGESDLGAADVDAEQEQTDRSIAAASSPSRGRADREIERGNTGLRQTLPVR